MTSPGCRAPSAFFIEKNNETPTESFKQMDPKHSGRNQVKELNLHLSMSHCAQQFFQHTYSGHTSSIHTSGRTEIERETERKREEVKERKKERETKREKERKRERGREGERERENERERGRERQRKRERERERKREREREKERKREKKRKKSSRAFLASALPNPGGTAFVLPCCLSCVYQT